MSENLSFKVSDISPDELELLAALLEEEEEEESQPFHIPTRPRGADAPLTSAQRQLWFFNQLTPDNAAYNINSVARLRGALDVDILARTLSEIVRRHEVLRTSFPSIQGQPTQVVAEPAPVKLTVRDVDGTVQEDAVRRMLDEEARRPFDLIRGPVLRAVLMRLCEEEHLLLLSIHHVATDGWSNGIFLKEVAALYGAFAKGEASPLPELPVQFGDYAVWERERLGGGALEKSISYWKMQLSGAPRVLDLPTDRPRPPVQKFQGASRRFELSRETTAALKALSLGEGATLFMTLLAAFQALLSRYSGEDDIVVGTPLVNRPPGTEALVGCFVNAIPMRADLSGEISFRDLLRRVRETVLEALDHQMPFELLLDELRLERTLSHAPLFQVAFTFQNELPVELELPGLKLSAWPADRVASKYDLTLGIIMEDGRLSGVLEYSTELFDPHTIERLLRHFERLLEGVIEDPDELLRRLPLMDEAERREVKGMAGTVMRSAPDACLHELFEAQVERAPDAVALTVGESLLTYAELNRRANQLAHHLRARGVKADDLVALYFESSVEMVIAILGVLKAGGAYLPLDPACPAERIAFMIEDAGAGLLLTQRGLAGQLPPHQAQVVILDDEGATLSSCSAENISDGAGGERLAYLIYTSGSTGRPKGVMVSHHNVARLFAATRPEFGFGERDVWTLFHSYAFDFSVWELWGALLHGGRLVLVPYGVSRNPDDFYELLCREGVTVLNQTPSAFKQLMAAEEARRGTDERLTLRAVIFGGEALELSCLRGWVERHGVERPRLVNMYGITETCVHVTYRRLLEDDVARARASVIGRPIADLQVYVLDKELQLVPVGVQGEMYVGGEGLARGYWRRAGLTAERFVAHPHSVEEGARLYRTGDLARYTPGGDLEYLGRADEQVKVRGFRIEPGEVSAVIRRHEGVRDAVVIAARGPSGEARLEGYFVRSGGQSPTPQELRAYARKSLPEYMVPAVLLPLSEIPLTRNGKVELKALAALTHSHAEAEGRYVAPCTETEEKLATVWREVLGVEKVGVHDKFFDLGGDSILSVRVVAAAKERGLSLSLQQLFQHQTISALAKEVLGGAQGSADETPVEPFGMLTNDDRLKLPADVVDAYPLAMLQAGMLYHMAYSPQQMVYHNVYSYHLRAPFDIETFETALRRAVGRHPILRTSFDLTTYSEPMQLVHETAPFPLPVEDLRALPWDEQETTLDAFVESERWRPFDVSSPPLLRFQVHRRTDETFNFTLSECHPIFDGWSLHSLLAEILQDYLNAPADEPTPQVDSLPVRGFADFVRLERAVLESDECRQFWAEKLNDCSIMQLPRWPPAPATAEAPPALADGARILKRVFPLSDELSEQLRSLARRVGVPLKSVLLAAHLKTLSLISGQADVLTGMVSVGRPEQPGGEKALGLFFNTLPFRLELTRGTWGDLIRETFRSEVEMMPFRRYPVAALQRQWGRQPLFESIFNYLQFHVLDGPLSSDKVEVFEDTRHWEETNLTLSTVFMLPPLSSRIQLRIRYDVTQFPARQIDELSETYKRVLCAMATDPDERHDRQSLLCDEELQRLIFECNESHPPRAQEPSIVEMFEEQAEKSPNSVAVVCEDEQLTFAELNRRANQLARHLRALGVRPETLVAVCLERSVEMLIAMLGVMKSGGAYTCLDPAYPFERTRLILEEARPLVLITQRGPAEDLPRCGAHTIDVDADWPTVARQSDRNLDAHAGPDNLLCLFFTSGSTGRPKGVAVEHRNILHYLRGILERLQLPAGASYAMVTSFTTDLANTVIFPALCTGGTLHVIRQERASDAAALSDYFARHPVDCLKIVPTHLTALLSASPHATLLPRLRLVLGGEALHTCLAEDIRRSTAACTVLNHYGPTETTVGASTYQVEPEDFNVHPATLPLGRPLPGTQIYILDANLNPVPSMAVGELYIGGEGVARGYHARPASTAAAFVPHPFGSRPGERLYRTGDLARRAPAGEIIFLGRADHQVKVRGYRLELGEVEAALREYPAVETALVTAREASPGGASLVAYVVLREEGASTPDELRAHLKARLPDYMLPSAFVTLKGLPLTPGGKVDRKALPLPDSIPSEPDGLYVAPRNEVEHIIAAAWCEALQVERVSADANFFDLGGHSLILLSVQSKLRHALRREVSILEMLEHPSIASLAEHICRADDAPASYEQAREQAEARRESLRRRRRSHQQQVGSEQSAGT